MVYKCGFSKTLDGKKMKRILKNKRVIMWLVFVALSVIFISPNLNPKGVVVTSVQDFSPAVDKIVKGEIIHKINDKDAVPEDFQGAFFDLVKFETNKGTKFVRANGTLGIIVERPPASNVKFGLDLKGGITATVKPEKSDSDTIQQIISTLQTRINIYGLRETVFRPVYYQGTGFVEISIAGGDEAELRNLIESEGKFEAKMPLILHFSEGQLDLSKKYPLKADADSLIVDGKKVNKTFELDGIQFSLESVSSNTINLTATVFTGNDVKIVFFDPQRSGVENAGNFYRWFFQVQITNEAANRFFWVAKNMKTYIDPGAGERYLESKIYFYLDDNFIDSLNVAANFKDVPVTNPSISGGAPSLSEAIAEKSKLQSILRSGALPTKIETVQFSSVSPTLGADFLQNAVLAGFVAIGGVLLIVFARYRKPKIVLPMMLVSLSEVLIIVGISARLGSTIDLPAIGGLIAAIGLGINDQIVIIDNVLRKEAREMTLSERLKKAFFVVFGAAGTIIAAMLPLLFSGFGFLTGFALTTIIGTLVGVLVTRPAFGVIAERLVSDASEK